MAWCRERIARYKTPRTVVFGPTLCRDCRWLIMNHDARLDESNGETFSNAEELIAGLNAG